MTVEMPRHDPPPRQVRRGLSVSAGIAIAGLLVSLPLAWGAGEQHRQSCIQQHRTGCGALPWQHGQAPIPPARVSGWGTAR
jgi:hypothetical protein